MIAFDNNNKYDNYNNDGNSNNNNDTEGLQRRTLNQDF